jgi:hypothetical protein
VLDELVGRLHEQVARSEVGLHVEVQELGEALLEAADELDGARRDQVRVADAGREAEAVGRLPVHADGALHGGAAEHREAAGDAGVDVPQERVVVDLAGAVVLLFAGEGEVVGVHPDAGDDLQPRDRREHALDVERRPVDERLVAKARVDRRDARLHAREAADLERKRDVDLEVEGVGEVVETTRDLEEVVGFPAQLVAQAPVVLKLPDAEPEAAGPLGAQADVGRLDAEEGLEGVGEARRASPLVAADQAVEGLEHAEVDALIAVAADDAEVILAAKGEDAEDVP